MHMSDFYKVAEMVRSILLLVTRGRQNAQDPILHYASGAEIFLEEIVRPGLREGPGSENQCS